MDSFQQKFTYDDPQFLGYDAEDEERAFTLLNPFEIELTITRREIVEKGRSAWSDIHDRANAAAIAHAQEEIPGFVRVDIDCCEEPSISEDWVAQIAAENFDIDLSLHGGFEL